jgi:hypothetical protein
LRHWHQHRFQLGLSRRHHQLGDDGYVHAGGVDRHCGFDDDFVGDDDVVRYAIIGSILC